MASVYDLKPRFQQLLKPVVMSLHNWGVTPNAVTIGAFLGSVGVGLLSLNASQDRRWLLVFPIWLFLRMALNAIDGLLARNYSQQSKLGGIFNEVGDVLSDIALYLPLAFMNIVEAWPVIFFVIGAVLTEFCGVLGAALGKTRQYQGPMGKSDRAFLIGTLALATWAIPSTERYLGILFWIAFGLCLWTCVRRIKAILVEGRND